MQTYQNKRRATGRATQPPTQKEAPSRSELLHLSGAGAPQPMSPQLREKFEPGFGADFSNIRISRGHIPEAMGVQAVAQGTDILLDESAGMDVLGHELAHVVQQAQGRVESGFPVVENAALEHEADVMGTRVASGLTAQAGPQNGFGGETMTIAPMSSASAPAQCKSRKDKKEEKQREKDQRLLHDIDVAEMWRDAAIEAAGDNEAEKKGAREWYANQVTSVVNNMSKRQLNNTVIQDRIIKIASDGTNKGMREVDARARANGTKAQAQEYANVLRTSAYEPEQRAMTRMMYRLMGGRKYFDKLLQSKNSSENASSENASSENASSENDRNMPKDKFISSEDRLKRFRNNALGSGVLEMLGKFTNETFQGLDEGGVLTDSPTFGNPNQRNLVMNNFSTRIIGHHLSNWSESEKLEKPDVYAQEIENSKNMNTLLRVDPRNGSQMPVGYEKNTWGSKEPVFSGEAKTFNDFLWMEQNRSNLRNNQPLVQKPKTRKQRMGWLKDRRT